MKQIICGIYKITSPSGRIYIGQSKDIKNRYNQYKRLDCVNQVPLYNSFVKYGFENHIFEIIEECSDEELNEKEGYWQDFYDCVKNGLNCVRVGCKNKKGFNSEETKQKRTNTLKTIEMPNYKKVINTENGIIYKSIREAARNEGFNHWQVENYLKGKSKNPTNLKYLDETIRPKESIIDLCNYSRIVLDNETGVFYYSVKEASEALNIGYSNMKNMLNGYSKNYTNLIYA